MKTYSNNIADVDTLNTVVSDFDTVKQGVADLNDTSEVLNQKLSATEQVCRF